MTEAIRSEPKILQQIVFQGKIETGTARVSLPAGTAPELVVDSPALMPLRSQDVKPAQFHHPLAEHDVRTSTGHVGGDGHGFRLTGPGHDLRLLLVVLGIENGMGNPGPRQHLAQHLGLLDRDGTDQDRLPPVIELLDLLHRGLELLPLGLVDHVRVVDSDHLLVGGDDDHIQLVGAHELRSLGVGRSGHACQLLVHAEEILERDGGQGLVFFGHAHSLLGLHGLVKTVAPAPARHHSSRELVHDHHLVVLDHVVDVLFKKPVGLDELVRGVEQLRGAQIPVLQLL